MEGEDIGDRTSTILIDGWTCRRGRRGRDCQSRHLVWKCIKNTCTEGKTGMTETVLNREVEPRDLVTYTVGKLEKRRSNQTGGGSARSGTIFYSVKSERRRELDNVCVYIRFIIL